MLRILLLVASLGTAHSALADQALRRVINEVDRIHRDLPVNDPSRPRMTLHLADLMFEESVDLGKNPTPTPKQEAELKRYRSQAFQYYREAHGTTTGESKTKVSFQMARILSDLGEPEKAIVYWREVNEQAELRELKRESALRIAEYYENSNRALTGSEAEKYYRQSIELCSNESNCSYAKYRYAWLLHNRGRHQAAADEIKAVLFDEKGIVRDEALRDWLLILGHTSEDGVQALNDLKPVAEKLGRPELLQLLSDSFYSHGNKIAGTKVLEELNAKQPNSKAQVKLLEEYYGFREWAKFRTLLGSLRKDGLKVGTDKEESAEAEKVLRRLSVQLDGERQSQKEMVADFQSLVMLYLATFPESKERQKMVDGWIASETNADLKLAQLKTWVDEDQARIVAGAQAGQKTASLFIKEERRLREMRASIAQKTGKQDIVAEEMGLLASAGTSDTKEQRRFRYQQAHALYERKEYDQALPLFVALASPKSPDEWAVQSQNLALDIAGQRKDFAAVRVQASLWTEDRLLAKKAAVDGSLAKELDDMRAVAEKAEFEQATALGEKPEALVVFQRFCEADKFRPKSCDNTKILAVKLKDQSKLLAVLKLQGNQTELVSEMEAAGYFAESAAALEKGLARSKSSDPYLKVALLYELAGQLDDRDRVLKQLVKGALSASEIKAHEALVYETLKDARLLDSSLVRLAWSEGTKLQLAGMLETSGRGTSETKKLLMEAKVYAGPAWSKLVLAEIGAAAAAEGKIQFLGKNGRRKFEIRLAALKKLTVLAKKRLEIADSATRSKIALILAAANQRLSREILSSPLPEGISPEATAELKAGIEGMAKPFVDESAGYVALAKEQAGKVTDESVKTQLLAAAQAPDLNATNVDQVAVLQAHPASEPVVSEALFQLPAYRQSIAVLHQDPNNSANLEKLQELCEKNGLLRLSSYYKGRARQLVPVLKKGENS